MDTEFTKTLEFPTDRDFHLYREWILKTYSDVSTARTKCYADGRTIAEVKYYWGGLGAELVGHAVGHHNACTPDEKR